MAQKFPLAPGTVRTALTANGVPAEWVCAPTSEEAAPAQPTAKSRTILYFHGGGYMVGSIQTHAALASELAHACQARVLNVNYRLAPEAPFPAAIEDATRAYRWLLAQGVSPRQIVIAGDSAGGGLTIATLLALRERGEALPAAAVCFSPWLDLGLTGATFTTKATCDPLVRREDLRFMAQAYLRGEKPEHPLASPLYANLQGLPPILIQVGTDEVLLDDAVRFADKAKLFGVEVTLDVWPQMIHVWQLFSFLLPESKRAIEAASRYVRTKTTA